MWIPVELILTVAAVFAAGVIRGFSGFGTGMVLVPSLSLLYEPVVAVVTVALLEAIPAIQLLRVGIAHCHWPTVIPMSVISTITVPLGALLLVSIEADTMRVIISIIVIVCVVILATGWRYKGDSGLKASAMTGALSGAITGATNLGGLPVILYYLSTSLTAQVTRASIIIFLVISAVVTLVTYTSYGIITKDILISTTWVAPVFLIAIWVGGRLFGKVSETFFRTATLTLLVGVSVMMLLS